MLERLKSDTISVSLRLGFSHAILDADHICFGSGSQYELSFQIVYVI